MRNRILAFLLTAAVSVALVGWGLFRGEFTAVLFNGALL